MNIKMPQLEKKADVEKRPMEQRKCCMRNPGIEIAQNLFQKLIPQDKHKHEHNAHMHTCTATQTPAEEQAERSIH